MIRPSGTLGLIATNTIAQGDTRVSGLCWICENGGEIYQARRRVRWPGLAAVIVSVLHLSKGPLVDIKHIDRTVARQITAFLFHRGGHNDPARLTTNANKSSVGSVLNGMGFTFDDTDKNGVATPVAEMLRLVSLDPRNQDIIYPFIGGEELNTSPRHMHHRYVINFHDYPLRRDELVKRWTDADEDRRIEWLRTGVVPLDYTAPVAADWPELLAIVEEKVRPMRIESARKSKSGHARDSIVWWKYIRQAKDLHTRIINLDRALAISSVSQHMAFAYIPSDMIYSHALILFPLDVEAAFCALQSRPHEIWARFFGSSMKDDLRYTPSDCFETFPFPKGLGDSSRSGGHW